MQDLRGPSNNEQTMNGGSRSHDKEGARERARPFPVSAGAFCSIGVRLRDSVGSLGCK